MYQMTLLLKKVFEDLVRRWRGRSHVAKKHHRIKLGWRRNMTKIQCWAKMTTLPLIFKLIGLDVLQPFRRECSMPPTFKWQGFMSPTFKRVGNLSPCTQKRMKLQRLVPPCTSMKPCMNEQGSCPTSRNSCRKTKVCVLKSIRNEREKSKYEGCAVKIITLKKLINGKCSKGGSKKEVKQEERLSTPPRWGWTLKKGSGKRMKKMWCRGQTLKGEEERR